MSIDHIHRTISVHITATEHRAVRNCDQRSLRKEVTVSLSFHDKECLCNGITIYNIINAVSIKIQYLDLMDIFDRKLAGNFYQGRKISVVLSEDHRDSIVCVVVQDEIFLLIPIDILDI